ncbi:MAG: alpha/beta hydrolase [Methanobacteriota archaeon]|nr:MAG: alpha/beta hydrolase [Euryarchaeota archaeon]
MARKRKSNIISLKDEIRKAWESNAFRRIVHKGAIPQVVETTREGNPLKALRARDGATIIYSDQKPLLEKKLNIVMVSGWACYPSIWREQAKMLRPYTRIIRVRKRGHFGSSLGKSNPYTYMRDIATDIKEVMDAEKIDEALIMGHSMGGMIALNFYTVYPSRVLALGLVSSPAVNPLRSTLIDASALTLPAELLFFFLQHMPVLDSIKESTVIRNNIMKTILRFLVNGSLSDGEHELLDYEFRYFYDKLTRVSMETIAMAFRAMTKFDLREMLQHVTVPTWVVAGLKDYAVNWRHSEYIAEKIGGNAMLSILPGGHLQMMQMKATFNSELLRFLNERLHLDLEIKDYTY